MANKSLNPIYATVNEIKGGNQRENTNKHTHTTCMTQLKNYWLTTAAGAKSRKFYPKVYQEIIIEIVTDWIHSVCYTAAAGADVGAIFTWISSNEEKISQGYLQLIIGGKTEKGKKVFSSCSLTYEKVFFTFYFSSVLCSLLILNICLLFFVDASPH